MRLKRKTHDIGPFVLKCCLDRCKTHAICRIFIDVYPMKLGYVHDWFVTLKMLVVLYINNLDFNDFYKFSTRHDIYNQCKANKKQIYQVLMSIAWHPLRW